MGGNYRLEVFDINGRIVDVLLEEYLDEGTYYIDWNGGSQYGESLPGGVYHVRLSNNKNVETIKLLMLK